LAAAAAWSAVVLFYPHALAHGERVLYGALLLLLWGMVAGFVHGIGYVPTNPLVRLALGPFFAWALLGGVTVWFVWQLQPGDPATG
jgi:tryptophan-rich sensory protein